MPAPLVLCRDTLLNADALETRTVPRRVLGRILIFPRGTVRHAVFWRLMAEMGVFRYALALLPFPVLAILKPSLALPIAQAPLVMILFIWLFESRLLGMSPEKRKALLDPDEIDRRRDALAARGRRALSRFAAGRAELSGTLTLVVEQSELARLPVLTLVSVQQQLPSKAVVLDLTARERDAVLAGLFDDGFSPEALHAVTLATSENLHSVSFDTRDVTAHARLQAMASG